MSYSLDIDGKLDEKLRKMRKRERHRLEMIWKKVAQILENPNHFKPLRGDLFGARRVRINGSFVLTYEVDEGRKVVKLLDFEHHDKIY